MVFACRSVVVCGGGKVGVFWSFTESFFEYIFGFGVSPDFKLKRQESISAISVTVDHDSAADSKTALVRHPLGMQDAFQEIFDHSVHFIDERDLFIFCL